MTQPPPAESARPAPVSTHAPLSEPPPEPTVAALLDELRAVDAEIGARCHAAYILGQRRARDAVPALVTALSDPSSLLRVSAREGLLLIPDGRGFAALLALPDLDSDSRGRLLRMALEQPDDERSIDMLAAIVRAQGPLLRFTRKRAAKRLGQLGGPAALALLWDVAADPDDGFRVFVQCILATNSDRASSD